MANHDNSWHLLTSRWLRVCWRDADSDAQLQKGRQLHPKLPSLQQTVRNSWNQRNHRAQRWNPNPSPINVTKFNPSNIYSWNDASDKKSKIVNSWNQADWRYRINFNAPLAATHVPENDSKSTCVLMATPQRWADVFTQVHSRSALLQVNRTSCYNQVVRENFKIIHRQSHSVELLR